MIVGLGQDVCEVKSINRTIQRFGGRFIHRVFTKEEQKSLTVDSSNIYQPFLRTFIKLLKGEIKYYKSFINLPLEASTILLGAKVAMEERRTIRLDDLPESTSFDGNQFIKEYRELRLKQWASR